MHRILVRIPFPGLENGVPIFSYGMLLMLGFAAGVFVAWRRARKINVPLQIVLDLGVYTAISGIIGARIAYILFEVDKPITEIPWSKFVAIWEGGLVLQGGLVLAILVSLAFLKQQKLPVAKIADCFAPGIAIGIMFGRMGCFLNGCCWGKICRPDFPLGVRLLESNGLIFQQAHLLSTQGDLQAKMLTLGYESDAISQITQSIDKAETAARLANMHPTITDFIAAGLPLPVHPAQLYASASLLGLFLVLLVIERLPRLFDGMIMLVFLQLYSVIRFGLEFIRDDTPIISLPGIGRSGLHMGQLVAIVTFIVTSGIFLYFWRQKRPGNNAAPLGKDTAT